MKKDAMKKRLSEGNEGYLKAGKAPLFLILFFFTVSTLPAQVKLNGFADATEIEVQEGFTGLYLTDYNEDGRSDIILYGKDEKTLTLIPSKNNGYDTPINKFFFYPVTDIKELKKRKYYPAVQIFVSRTERLAGIASFTKYGTLQLLNQIEFDSYPERIAIGDADNDGVPEAAVFGHNFNGISIIDENNFFLTDNKIAEGRVFSYVSFSDIDYDGYYDITAMDILNNCVSFFYNDHRGNFDTERCYNLGFGEKLIGVGDADNDGFTDIFISTANGVYISKGDSVSSFSDREFFELYHRPEKVYKEDLNDDKEDDFIFPSKDGRVVVYLSDSTTGNFGSIIPYSSYRVKDAAITGKRKSLVILSDKRVSVINRIAENFESTGLAYTLTGRNPVLFSSGKKPGIALLDTLNNSLKVFYSGSGYFESLMNIKLQGNYSRIANSHSNNGSTFVLYEPGNSLVGIINIDSGKVERKDIYTKYPAGKIEVTDTAYFITENTGDSVVFKSISKLYFENPGIETGTPGRTGLYGGGSLYNGGYIFSPAEFSDSLFVVKEDTAGAVTRYFAGLGGEIDTLLKYGNSGVMVITRTGGKASFGIPEGKRIKFLDTKNKGIKRITEFGYSNKTGTYYGYDNLSKKLYLLKPDPVQNNISVTKVIDSVDSDGYFDMLYSGGKLYITYKSDNNVRILKVK